MAKEMRPVIKRINRKLAAKGPNSKGRTPLDEYEAGLRRLLYYRLERERMGTNIDPEELAHKLGVLKKGEEMGRSWAGTITAVARSYTSRHNGAA